ncbi:MAG: acyltransferase [Verrucomicrobiota bacterium]
MPKNVIRPWRQLVLRRWNLNLTLAFMADGGKRIFGLDAMRATAITLVIVSHLSLLYTSGPESPLMSFLGTMGVEIFFVLSGFLIGGIIIRLMHAHRFNTLPDLWHFWLNRWFRTLPAYYFFVLFFAFFHGHFFWQLVHHASYLFFLQNLAWNVQETFFGQSWSLAVEEWFYLLFPLLLYGAFAWGRLPLRASVFGVALSLFGLSLALRIAHGPASNLPDFGESIRKWVIFRFDALMIGVLTAYARCEMPRLWQFLLAAMGPFFVAYGAICLFMIFGIQWLLIMPWLQMIFLPVVSLAIAAILPVFAEWESSTSLLRAPTVGLARISYSLYLVHIVPIHLMLRSRLFQHHPWYAPLVALAAMILFGAGTYALIEAPIMRWRAQWNKRFQAGQDVPVAKEALV